MLRQATIEATRAIRPWLAHTKHDWQASVGSLVDRWLAERHAGAIAVVDWTHLVPDTAYPWDGWWWVGVKAQESDTDLSDLADTLVELLPDAFKAQAVTWAAILVHVMGLRTTDDEAQAHEAMMQTVALAYWLAGFAAVTDDDFFDFSAADALAVSGLDPLRLGFEAGQQHAAKLGHLFDGNEDSNEALSWPSRNPTSIHPCGLRATNCAAAWMPASTRTMCCSCCSSSTSATSTPTAMSLRRPWSFPPVPASKTWSP
jgi:hypothetical protein